jgi:hypothetical protein
MRKLEAILTDLAAAEDYYGVLEHRLSALEEQIVAARAQLNAQGDVVRRLMLEQEAAQK